MRFMKVFVLCCWVLGLCLVQAAAAKEKEDSPDCPNDEPIDLGDIYVTAFHGGAVTITPTKTVIDIEKFNKSGSVDRVEDILMHLTGIDVLRGTSGADPQTMVMMRGFDDSRFTIAIDGRTITGPTAGADTYVDWSSLTSGDIEKIEVIRGAASAQYENSQGGIINIITKKGKKKDTLKPDISLTTDYSRFNSFVGRVAVDGGVGDLGYFLNYGYKESDGYLLNNNYQGYDYSTRVNYTFPFEGLLTLGLKGSQLDHGFAVVNDPDCTLKVYPNDPAGTLLVKDLYDPDYPIVRQDSDTVRRYRYTSFPGGDNNKDKSARHMDLAFEQPVKDVRLKFQLYKSTGQEDAIYYRAVRGDGNGDGVVEPGELKLASYFSGGEGRKEAQKGGRFQMIIDQWEDHNLVLGYDQRRMEVENKPDVWRMNAVYTEDTWNFAQKWTSFLGIRYAHIREWTYEYKESASASSERHLLKTVEWLPKSTLTYRYTPDTELFVSVNRDYHVPGC